MYHVSVKTDSGSEPVTEAVIKNFIKYDESDTTEITLINNLVKSARELLEKLLNASLKSKTYTLQFDYRALDDYTLRIPYSPIVSVTSVTYYDDEGTDEVYTLNTDYYLRGGQSKEIYLPAVETVGYYVIEYVAGYGGSGVESLPEVIETAICELVKFWYDRVENDFSIPISIRAKVMPYAKVYYI